MRRVAVIGSSGAGKSVFSLELGRALGLPVIHLDRHYWQPGWVKTPRDAWQERERVLLRGDAWIADGNFWSTLELRLEAADTIIFLDMPRLLCLWRVLRRILAYRPGTRPDMAEGCHERLDLAFLNLQTVKAAEKPAGSRRISRQATVLWMFTNLAGPKPGLPSKRMGAWLASF